ncbi:Glycerol-3-phosphate o-acyltransferase [Mycena indigotica]|uniref:Glycerol-3-phosphate o-acyltransferase n=1 Tax=Mycena indigotica TaxID=2126181 RepID=A0A8H6SA71_9AGAR|nr:Glycerol-3-phosphate o-acyltransferase [Mycena indigotica]KAF7294956.1 Glycerol-3-phosphate o-acyltransferase [Mycena indigotica]
MAPNSAAPWSYAAIMAFWNVVTAIFFREIRPRGAFNIPSTGPVIVVVAPHSNQFVDPLLVSLNVWRETRRPVQFLAAAKSMERKAIGFFSRVMLSIPVARALDSAKKGTGLLRLAEDDPCLVLGSGTKFLTEVGPKMQLLLSKSMNSLVAEVIEVISDTELRIKKEFGGPKGTAKIRERVTELQAGLDFKIVPFIDQADMYRTVYQCLSSGGSMGIFPEGGSHDRTDLLPFKAGVSLMALGAMANDPNLRVKIVPCGLSYFHAHRFRSRAVVEFGRAIEVPSEYVEMFKKGGADKREAVSKFLDLIFDGLKTVTVRAPDYDTLMLIQAARRLYKTPGQHLTLGQNVELNRRLLEGYEHFKDDPQVQQVRDRVLKYNRLVRDLGLRDHQVPRATKASWKTLSLLAYRVGLLAVWTIFALPGTILNSPVFILASLISRRKAKEALAASVVKVAGRDVLATWKILVTLAMVPIQCFSYAWIATFLLPSGAPLKWRLLTPLVALFGVPLMSVAALKFGEAGRDVLFSLRPLMLALTRQKVLEDLKAKRIALANDVAQLITALGPKLYEDFNEWRILVPASTAPPSTSTPGGLWRRKSATGGVDSQGLGLIHPMTWLDERLFGWSRSSVRGTSAWGGHSTDASRLNSPNESEDEDAGDYENVLRLLPGEPSMSTSRSRQNSYADLQRLRLNTQPLSSITTTTTSSKSISPTEGSPRRDRKASLSDGVPVERIASVDQVEHFDQTTQNLNEEIQMMRKRKKTVD